MPTAIGSHVSLLGVRHATVVVCMEACLMKSYALALTLALVGCGPEAPSPGQDAPDIRQQILVQVGEAHDRGGTRIPVSAINYTGRRQPYILLECGLYLGGRLIETTQISWANVEPGQTVTGSLLPDARKADRVDCRPSVG